MKVFKSLVTGALPGRPLLPAVKVGVHQRNEWVMFLSVVLLVVLRIVASVGLVASVPPEFQVRKAQWYCGKLGVP